MKYVISTTRIVETENFLIFYTFITGIYFVLLIKNFTIETLKSKKSF